MEFHEYHAWRKGLTLPEIGTRYELLQDYAGVNYHNRFKKGQWLVLDKIRDPLLRYVKIGSIDADQSAVLTLISKKGKRFKRTLYINVEGIHAWIRDGKLRELPKDS